MEGPKARARHGGAKRRSTEGMGSGEGRRSPSPVWGSGGIAPRTFWNKDSSSIRCFSFAVRNLHCILLLHIAHSSKVNCTLDKVNCTLCVRKHNFRPWPALLIPVLVARNRTSTHHFNDLAPMRETIKKITSWLLSINLYLFVIYLFIYLFIIIIIYLLYLFIINVVFNLPDHL